MVKVFISWSGAASRQIAKLLGNYLPDVLQSVEPWMSEQDILAGERWGKELDKELDS